MNTKRRNWRTNTKGKKKEEIWRAGFVTEYLRSQPCVGIDPEGCPYRETDPFVLTFHHVRGTKKMDISQMVNQGYSLPAMQEEIEKCIVLCFNCHMRSEKQRRGTKYV
jgi:hypothetical protein